MTTSSTAIFVPFMTRELRMDGPSLYYGMNALSHNVHHADRKKLKSANGLYLGSTGSGKSFAAKRELLNVFLAIPQDRIIVVDPMGEYAPLVRRLGGQVIEIAPDSPAPSQSDGCGAQYGCRRKPAFHEGGFSFVPVRAGGRRQGRLAAH